MKKRLDQKRGFDLRLTVGTCPLCLAFRSENLDPAVIYRRSHRSVTMRCENCGLRWNMTLNRIHQAAGVYKNELATSIGMLTELAFQQETRGRRKEIPGVHLQ